MSRFSRCLAVLLIAVFALPAGLQAAEPRRAVEPVRNAWTMLEQLWSFLTGAQLDNGCEADPNGRCLRGHSAPAAADNGCEADPDGRCLRGHSAPAAADNGCEADPSGRCRS